MSIKSEIQEMFAEFSENEYAQSFAFVAQVFGSKNKINADFVIDRRPSYEETEHLEVVMKMYEKDYSPCTYCGGIDKYKRVDGRRAYQCIVCNRQESPTANTIFHKTTTPLKKWFALIKSLAEGHINIIEIRDKLGVSHKTAHRMRKLIWGETFFKKIQDHIYKINNTFLIDAEIVEFKHSRPTRKRKDKKDQIVIKRILVNEIMKPQDVANLYDIDIRNVYKIKNGKQWQAVPLY